MPWPGSPLPVALLLLVATVGPPGVSAEGNVGCLFSERLCLEEEWCYDDFAFGRCLQAAGDVDEDDLYRYSLEREILHVISSELRRLFALGYRWSHGYTQCRLQAILYATKHDLPFESDACSHLVDQDLEGALNALEMQEGPLDPREVAIIKYTPSVDKPHGEFADEVYYPPVDDTERQVLREKILPSNAIDILDMEDPYAQYAEMQKRAWIPQMHRRSLPIDRQNFDLEFIQPPESPEEVQLTFDDLEELYPIIKYLKQKQMDDEEETMEEGTSDDPLGRFSMNYNTPDGFRRGWESRDTLPEEYLQESRIYDESEDAEDSQNGEEYGSGFNTLPDVFRELENTKENREIFRELQNRQKGSNPGGIYTEGGVIYAPKFDDENEKDIDEFLSSYNAGFKRPERLDVKKPGPPFATKIYDDKRAIPGKHPKYKEKEAKLSQPDFLVDTDYVYVEFENNNIQHWAQGNQIIRNISQLLELDSQAFTHGRVDHNEVTFKVDSAYTNGLNASEIIKKIDAIRDDLKLLTGIEITKIGIGDKTKMRASFVSKALDNNEFYVVIFTICGILGAMIIAAGLLLIIKRHLKTKEKLQGLARPDTEASKDYQELCRARMAAKGQQERITSLSRESEQSPSSRSSTSSWSEEPALHNMDISTGHMVLSYMEDHLKNKDRLDQEWVALCAYVAEPCETTIALKKDNIEKNRYKDIVPYDHSRVVLNELSNATGSDYINASSITDHDPRNPAYIATQGPLPHTTPDFWQLIWEQGAVVIVMLTRLTEGGTAMCHHYWPEEGSELYHIYEVHLVSEHIWCDDYLVRSFYLKNIRTGETRTVTQFHFLSWPESGVPSSTKALLEFRRKVNKSYRGRSCPIVVHCSDGAGRAGTYCLIDMVLSRMAKGAKEIDIAATLEHLRDQRLRMVATKQQFEFVLTAVAEEVHAILKALPPQPTTSTQAETTKDKQ